MTEIKSKSAKTKVKYKPGYSVKTIKGADTDYHEPRLTTLTLDREVLQKAKLLFPGQISMLVNIFLREVIKQKPRIIFEMPFSRPDNVPQNPFNRPSLIVQIDKRTKQVVATFDTLFKAHQATGIEAGNIEQVCNRWKNRKQAGGFIWRYEDDNEFLIKPDNYAGNSYNRY